MDDRVNIPKKGTEPNAAAGAVRKALDEWAEAVNARSVERTTALYAPGAVLLPTFNPAVLTTPEGRKNYFVNFLAKKNLAASIGECHIEALGADAGMANGLYTFRFVDESGAPQTVKARFSFVYARQPEGDWPIVAHHSSVGPG